MEPQNPYVIGNSVGNSPAFVGRAKILRDVSQVLRHSQQNAIALFGQRRIGKTSLLRELEAKLPQAQEKETAYCPIFFDLQDKATWPLEQVLRALAQEISHVLQTEKPDLGTDPETTFSDVWLPEVLNTFSSEKSLVLLFDEFDVLDDPEAKQAGEAFFPYLRQLLDFSDRQRLNFVFVIGRKIDDLTNIAKSLFKSPPTIQVSLLDREDTVKLVRLSETNKSLNWTDEAIEAVWQLIHGHPYFTQSLCYRVWEDIYENKPDEPTVTRKHVEKAIPKTLEASHGAFEWLWGGLPLTEQVVASVLAGAGAKAMTETQLDSLLRESGVQMVIQDLENAPQLLKGWGLIEPAEGDYRFRVELLRRWIAEHKPLSLVQEELDRIDPIADNLYKASLGLFNQGKINNALPLVHQAVEINSRHEGANQLLADILIKQKQFDEARGKLEWLYKSKPKAARTRLILVLLSLAQEAKDNENEQLNLYERVLELEPEHPEAKSGKQAIWQKRGDKAYYETGDLEAALEAYKKADNVDKIHEIEEKMSKKAQLPEWYQRALKALEKGDRETARTLLAQVIAIDPTYKQASRYLHLVVKDVDSIKLNKSLWKWRIAVVLMALAFGAAMSWLFMHEEPIPYLPETQRIEELQFEIEQLRIKVETKYQQPTQGDRRTNSISNTDMGKKPPLNTDSEKVQKLQKQVSELQKQVQTLREELKTEKKQVQTLKEELKTAKWHNKGLYEFLQKLESGNRIVVVSTAKSKKKARDKVEDIKKSYPELFFVQEGTPLYKKFGEGIYLDSDEKQKKNIWVVYIGGYYSSKSARALVKKAKEELGMPKDTYYQYVPRRFRTQ
jgi:tetratricopeptide (TPR) repeat protein